MFKRLLTSVSALALGILPVGAQNVYPPVIPGGASLLPLNNTWSGKNTFTGPVIIPNNCTTSQSLGMDATGASDNYSILNTWLATQGSAPAYNICLSFGPGKFKFLTAPTITVPDPLWSTSSTTSNSIGTGTKTFTVASCTGITPGTTAFAYHTSSNVMSGTVTSCSAGTLTLNITTINNGGGGPYTAWGLVQSYLGGANTGSVTFVGQGMDTTTLLMSGGISGFTFQFAGLIQTAVIQGMSIVSDTTGGQPVACLALNNSYPFLGAEQSIVQVRNIACRGADGYGAVDYWTTNFSVTGLSNINFDGIIAYGDNTTLHGTGLSFYNPGANGCVPSPDTSPWQCGENYNIRDSYFNNLNYGIFYGANTQFVQVTSTQFLQDQKGIIASSTGGTNFAQGLTLTGDVFWAYQEQLDDLYGIRNTQIIGNFFAMNPSHYAIFEAPNWAVTIVGNTFTTYVTTPLGAISFNGTSNDLSVIAGNVISNAVGAIPTCVSLGVSTSGVFIYGNTFSGCTVTIVNNGTNNLVGVTGSGATTGSNTVVQGITIQQ